MKVDIDDMFGSDGVMSIDPVISTLLILVS